MKFETLKPGDYIEAAFMSFNGGGWERYFELSAEVVYVHHSPSFAVLIDNENKPYMVLSHKFKKIKHAIRPVI